MTLKEWLEDKGMTGPQFATRIGRSSEAVRRYVAGERIPDRDTMPLVVKETSGAVTPNDFFGILAEEAA
ncbi:transcriptional regulator with XRE-family HTH domain [Sphingomonas jinjuensis]|uniref:Transcriptional regulator with XRE-family HTH domain n=1 Tax=Sphingomonas jinjuensis TaxID=535907 RepID=A0A840FBX2_9SPHN|nr:helix-turn-helix transcriptional regulator [Sphingomonas jinjuensis]MBB4154142.1 transcriptional regulator with XRE-family HTH domain [Sphingomonas jinjuensis]